MKDFPFRCNFVLRSVATLLCVALVGCASQEPARPKLTPEIQRDLQRYSSFRTGYYETQPPAADRVDSTSVKLHIARLWREREGEGEFWFYLEYALAGKEGAPYWQRLVLAREASGALEEVEYELPGDAQRFIGAWRDGQAFARVDVARLREIPGCRLLLMTQQLTLFSSGMAGRECRSGPAGSPPGAIRVSEYFMASSFLRAWDRGYDKDGKVAWGSAAGPLEMLRYSQAPR